MAIPSILALMAIVASVAIPTTVTPPPGSEPQETLAAAYDIAERMTIDTHVNGEGPFSFTIDTGSDRSIISDRLAQRLNLRPGAAVTIFGIGGPQSVSTVQLDRLRIGQRERLDFSAPVLPERSLGSSGFLGIDTLRDQSVLLDFKHHRVTIARSPREAMQGDPDVIVVTGRSRFGQLILTDARVGNVKVYAIVDTGAQNTIGNLALRKMLGRKGPLPLGRGAVVGVTGVELPAEPSSIRRIQLGGMTLVNMPIAFADVQTFRLFGVDSKPAILVGMDVLRGFERVAVDFKRREVRFRVGDGWIGQNGPVAQAHGTATTLAL